VVYCAYLLHHTAEETSDPGAPRAVRKGPVGILEFGIQRRLLNRLLIGSRGGGSCRGGIVGEGLGEMVVGDVHPVSCSIEFAIAVALLFEKP